MTVAATWRKPDIPPASDFDLLAQVNFYRQNCVDGPFVAGVSAGSAEARIK
jgi:hypothetical protein